MNSETFRSILSVGETVAVEFKRCGNGVEHDTYESVCSFLNRFGGDLFLGVLDDGTVVGVPEKAAPDIKIRGLHFRDISIPCQESVRDIINGKTALPTPKPINSPMGMPTAANIRACRLTSLPICIFVVPMVFSKP